MELHVRNVNEALSDGLMYLRVAGTKQNSRNGPVLVAPEPVTTVYSQPRERVLFSPLRNANPFFHLMEALWMLAGRNDLEWPAYFNSKFAQYSDDGVTVHGAYGDRWRGGLGFDQLAVIVEELKKNPESRRCVLQMWDATTTGEGGYLAGDYDDLHKAIDGGKDVPCNTHAYFLVQDGALNVTVCCRSNDILWGACGANAVHMSVMHEYVARCAGLPVGTYRQFSNNYHLYTGLFADHQLGPEYALWELAADADQHNHYVRGMPISPMFNLIDMAEWDAELDLFMRDPMGDHAYRDPFFRECAFPMYGMWKERKEKRGTGEDWLHLMRPRYNDWAAACETWIDMRETEKRITTT